MRGETASLAEVNVCCCCCSAHQVTKSGWISPNEKKIKEQSSCLIEPKLSLKWNPLCQRQKPEESHLYGLFCNLLHHSAIHRKAIKAEPSESMLHAFSFISCWSHQRVASACCWEERIFPVNLCHLWVISLLNGPIEPLPVYHSLVPLWEKKNEWLPVSKSLFNVFSTKISQRKNGDRST